MNGMIGSSHNVSFVDRNSMKANATSPEKPSTIKVRLPTPMSWRTRLRSLMARAIRSPVGKRAKKRGPCNSKCQ
jgi:hypothetical protein